MRHIRRGFSQFYCNRSQIGVENGTAAFYNYIYYTIAGFSEFDTVRSNQIREGMMSREQALALVDKENGPRFDSMEWYAKVVGFDLDRAIRVINSVPKRWET